MIEIDINKVSYIIKECVETVIMPHYQNLQSGEVEEKAPNDYVTIADKESEIFLTKKLTELLPNSIVIGEEAVSADIKVLDRIKDKNPVWIIDPIDGTRHFIKGDRRWGVLLALSLNDKTEYGWIYDVIEQRMIVVKRGVGVWVNGEKFTRKFEHLNKLSDIKIGCHNPILCIKELQDDLKTFKEIEENYCSVEHLSDFILGASVDVLAGLGKVNSWDNAAGFLATEELGAYMRMADGSEYKPSFYGRSLWVIAPNKEIWQQVIDIIKLKVKN